MLAYIGVAVAVVAVAMAVVARRLQQRRQAYHAALAVHHSRLWRVIACLECATEIFPGNDRMVCGGCHEELNYCMPCFRRTRGAPSYTPAEHDATHELLREPTDWEVDPASVERARSTAAAVRASLRLYADRRCLGRRVRSGTGELERRFEWWSYAEVEARAWALLRSIVRHHTRRDLSHADLETAATALIGQRFVTCCISVMEFYVAQYAAVLGGLVMVPMHATTGVAGMAHVLGLTRPIAVLTSRHLRVAFETALAMAAASSTTSRIDTGDNGCDLRDVVLVSVADQGDTYELRREHDLLVRRELELELERKLQGQAEGEGELDVIAATMLGPNATFKWVPFDEAVAEATSVSSTTQRGGRVVLDPSELELRASMAELDARDEYEAIVMLLPTSGTSSSPKLTIFTDHMLRTQCQPPRHAVQTVMLAHELLRQSVDLLAKGGCVAVFSGSLAHLQDDLQLVRPTVFGATPTFWYGLHQRYQSELERLKSDRMRSDDAPRSTLHELENELRQRWHRERPLGNRCKFAIVGGAGTSAAFRDWIATTLQCVVIDGYGATEVGGLASNANVLAGRNVQLIDCHELGYLTSDRPHARGEIVAHTDRMTPGYFGDAAATAERFVTISGVRFFRTGDIGEMVGTQIRVIDRRGDIFKLAQGVFVAPSPLEQLYSACEFCSNVFIYGEASMHRVMAAVYVDPSTPVPADDASTSTSMSTSTSTTTTANSLDDVTLERRILESFRALAHKAHVHAWEIPGRVIVDREAPWSNSNRLLSTIGKLCRPALVQRFAPRFRAALGPLPTSETQTEDEQAATTAVTGTSQLPVIEGLSSGLVQLLLETLPSNSGALVDVTAATSIADLGADSLSLARLVAQIRERYGVSIPLPALAKLPSLLHLQLLVFSGGAFSLESLNEEKRPVVPSGGGGSSSSSGARPCHGEQDTRRWYKQVDDLWQPTGDASDTEPSLAQCLKSARWLSSAELQQRNAILLTGATGFYGSFVLHQLLTSAALNRTRIHCIVRATSAHHGLQRIVASLESYGLPTHELDRVVAEPGDLERPWMGLDASRVEQLTRELLLVVHNGAIVNSFLTYEALRPANVLGTKAALMLAASAGVPLHHVSTIGMLSGSGTLDEERTVAPGALRLLSGYAQSKWVAEQLAHRASEAGMSITISRPGTIAGHSISGACNLNDTVIRLIAGLAHERIVCCGDGTPLSTVYLLVPVDWAAEALVHIVEHQVARAPNAIQPNNVFHLVSRSPVPLSQMAAAIRAVGIELTDLPPDEFKQRMSALASNESHPLFVFASILGGTGYTSGSSTSCPSDTNTVALLHQGCPQVSDDMLHAMLRYCIARLGLIPTVPHA